MYINPNYIIYLEDQYQPKLNKFIQKNRHKIDKYIIKNRKSDLQFFYLPEIKNQINPQILQYTNPLISEDKAYELSDALIKLTTPELAEIIFKQVGHQGEIFPGLFRYNNHPDDANKYYYTRIDGKFPAQWKSFFNNYFRLARKSYDENEEALKKAHFYQPAFRLTLSPEQEKIEEKFYKYGNELSQEALEIIKQVKDPKQLELLMQFLDSRMSELDNKTKLSRILINEYEIRLPDYNKIIELTPLQKSVYILFLRHDEGINLKNLPDYKEELLDIYLKLSKRGKMEDIKSSINSLVDPLENSIHEKFSKIKSAFLTQFDDRLASHYYITGAKAQLKRITIDRNLVELDI